MIANLFESAWSYLVANKDTIILTILSGEFITLVFSLISVFRNRKSTKENTLTLSSWISNIPVLTNVANSTNELKKEVLNNTSAIKEELHVQEESKELILLLLNKFNTLITVFMSVYSSSIKDDKVRENVVGTLLSALNCESVSKAKLKDALEDIKSKFKESLSKVENTVSNTVNEVEVAISANKDAMESSALLRY